MILASATPSLETLWNAETGRYRWLKLAARHGGVAAARGRARSTCATRRPSRALAVARRSSRPWCETLAQRRTDAAVPQPAGLCAAGPLPRVRRAAERARHRFLAGRASLFGPARLPPDRLFDAQARPLPPLRRGRRLVSIGPGVERVEEEARALFPEAARRGLLLRHRVRRRGRPGDGPGHGGRARSTSWSPPRPPPRGMTFPCSRSSASSTRTSACAAATCARPSAPSSCSPRPAGGPDGASGRAARCCRPTRPSSR